jgi:hypothetical protein
MPGKSDTFENDALRLFFNNTAIATVGDASGLQPSAAAGSLYLALHTADPGEAGTQTTSEVAYTSYARAAVARTAGGFTVSGNTVTLTSNVSFPAGTGGSGVATHFSVGTAASGAGKILYFGAITPSITCGNGITPQLTTTTNLTED